MIMRIWKHIRKYWFYIVCSLIFAALSVASQLYVPILTGNAIDHMIGVGKVDFAGDRGSDCRDGDLPVDLWYLQ